MWSRSELVKDEKYLEKIMINKMKEKYGGPIYGREYFVCENYEDIKVIFNDVIKLDREPNINSDIMKLDREQNINNEISNRENILDDKIKCFNCDFYSPDKCVCELPCYICGWWGKHCVCKSPCDMCGW